MHRALGRRVQQLRRERGLRAAQLSRAAGIPTGEVHDIEAGRIDLEFSTLSRLASVLSLPLFQLVTFPEDGFVEEHVDSLRRTRLRSFLQMLDSTIGRTQQYDAHEKSLAAEFLATTSRGSKLKAVEEAIVHQAIVECRGNLSQAARLLGVDRKAVARRWRRIASGG